MGDSRGDIAIIRNGGRGPVDPLVATRFEERYPAVSPDGRWLAYASDQSGTSDVYVRPLDRDGQEIRVSVAGGSEPMWGPDGRELFYREPVANAVMLTAATLAFAPALTVTARRQLFDVSQMSTTAPHSNYDVSPDGRTFAMVRQNPATRIMVLQNVPALVRQMERGDEAMTTAPSDRLAAALADRYRLERELGQGGMATVYLAEDLKHGRKVAIKVLHPELSAVIGGERFLAEIKVTANLQHPHILGLIDSGEADGLLYYVMPYVAGRVAARSPRAREAAPRRRRRPPLEGSRRRPRLRPPPGRRPPRHQAREHPAAGRRRPRRRLRHRARRAAGRRQPHDPDRHVPRHAGLHVAPSRPWASATSAPAATSTPSAP